MTIYIKNKWRNFNQTTIPGKLICVSDWHRHQLYLKTWKLFKYFNWCRIKVSQRPKFDILAIKGLTSENSDAFKSWSKTRIKKLVPVNSKRYFCTRITLLENSNLGFVNFSLSPIINGRAIVSPVNVNIKVSFPSDMQ